MDSFSRKSLSQVFERVGEWRKTKDPLNLKWSQFHLSVIHGYVLKLNLTPDSSLLSLANLLNQQFSNRVPPYSEQYDDKVASLMHALQEVFVVPQQHQLFEKDEAINKSGLIAAFMDVLLRLLHCGPGSDRIECLRKDLRFLLAVLGDESFISSDNLMAEIEAVANKVGSLAHLIIFSNKSVEDVRFGALLRRMDHLKADVGSLFIVDSLLDDLEELLRREDDVISDVKDQIRMLQQELKLSNSFIKNPQPLKSKEYVMRIREVAYEVEYLINSFLVGDASCRYLSISLSHAIRKIKSGIQGSERNFEVSVSKFSQLSLQNKSSSDVEDVIGFEERELEILHYLKGEEKNLQIASICGMPGIGKTTLAKKLYRHPSFKDEFDICSWCVVSQRYQMKNLLIDILVNLNYVLDKEEMLNIPEASLKTLIYQFLYKRRYLIVMDDLWSSDAWSDLQACFPDNRNRSRILFTSRNKNVAPPRYCKIYELPLMSDGHCWELLRKKVFQDEPCPRHLEKIGEKIATSCHGVPLAVVVIAGILSSMNNQEST